MTAVLSHQTHSYVYKLGVVVGHRSVGEVQRVFEPYSDVVSMIERCIQYGPGCHSQAVLQSTEPYAGLVKDLVDCCRG